MPCALCSFQDNELALKLNEFITHYIGVMDETSICNQVSDILRSSMQGRRMQDADSVGDEDAEQLGMDPESIRVHITTHMLHPRVKLAVTLRKLLDFIRYLEDNLTLRDEETGVVSVDKTNTELYIKATSQVFPRPAALTPRRPRTMRSNQ